MLAKKVFLAVVTLFCISMSYILTAKKQSRTELNPDVYSGKDRAWALALAQAQLIKTEATINKPYYFYKVS